MKEEMTIYYYKINTKEIKLKTMNLIIKRKPWKKKKAFCKKLEVVSVKLNKIKYKLNVRIKNHK